MILNRNASFELYNEAQSPKRCRCSRRLAVRYPEDGKVIEKPTGMLLI